MDRRKRRWSSTKAPTRAKREALQMILAAGGWTRTFAIFIGDVRGIPRSPRRLDLFLQPPALCTCARLPDSVVGSPSASALDFTYR